MSDFLKSLVNTQDKRYVSVVTVHPESRIVVCQDLQSGGRIVVSVEYSEAAFRWPKEEEVWAIRRDNQKWFLLGRVENPVAADDALYSINAGRPGDVLLNGERATINGHEVSRVVKTKIFGGNPVLVWHGLNTMNVVCQVSMDPVSAELSAPFEWGDTRVLVDSTYGFSSNGYIYIDGFRLNYVGIGPDYFDSVSRVGEVDSFEKGDKVYQPRFPPPFTFRAASPDYVEVSTGDVTLSDPDISITIIG